MKLIAFCTFRNVFLPTLALRDTAPFRTLLRLSNVQVVKCTIIKYVKYKRTQETGLKLIEKKISPVVLLIVK